MSSLRSTIQDKLLVDIVAKPVSVNITITSEVSVGGKQLMVESIPVTMCYDDFMEAINISTEPKEEKKNKSNFQSRMEEIQKQREEAQNGV